MNASDQAQVRQWLVELGGERLLALDLPRLNIHGVRVAFDKQASSVTAA
jgi:hypothetical protein